MLQVTCSRSISLPSVFTTASLRVAAHCWDMPTLAEVGGSASPGGVRPSLPARPSRMPGKKLAARGWSITSPTTTHWNMARSSNLEACMTSCTLLAWADSF